MRHLYVAGYDAGAVAFYSHPNVRPVDAAARRLRRLAFSLRHAPRHPAVQTQAGRRQPAARRRVTRRSSSRGSPSGSTDGSGEPEPPLASRLPSAGVLYARAAQLERLSCAYAEQGRADLFYIGCNLAEQLERIADRRAA